MTISEEKQALRRALREQERTLTPDYRVQADASIAAHLLALDSYQSARTVFCFVSTPREIDTHPILLDALKTGKRLCVPRCAPERQMDLVHIHSMDDLEAGAYGIWEPKSGLPCLMPEEIDLAVLPCLSCDRQGGRLGRGGGYYDRFLAVYPGSSVLLCREALLQPQLPLEPHDISIPCVITEAGVYDNGSIR